jgi:hypothetical protein
MISIADAFLHDAKKWDIALIQGLVDDNTVTKILKNGIYLVCSTLSSLYGGYFVYRASPNCR